MSSAPFISIVTVVYNAKDDIKNTIESVVGQSQKNFEYIVIDGGSKDGTLDIINTYKEQIDLLISEADKGIYDAMNKGIALAGGEWIYFLNAGDSFYNTEVLKELEELDKQSDLIYGKNEADYGYFKRINHPLEYRLIERGMIFSHQAMITKTARLKSRPFDTKYKMSADFDYIYSLHKAEHKFQETDLIFASLKADGASEKNQLKTHWERASIVTSYPMGFFRKSMILARYTSMAIGIIFKKMLKFILPKKSVQRLTKKKYES